MLGKSPAEFLPCLAACRLQLVLTATGRSPEEIRYRMPQYKAEFAEQFGLDVSIDFWEVKSHLPAMIAGFSRRLLNVFNLFLVTYGFASISYGRT